MKEDFLKVSILTVVKNGSKTVQRCINSILHQEYTHIEIIVIDGNSTDETLSIAQSLKTSKMMIVSAHDNGIYDALNKGIALATGDIVGLLHADDYLKDTNVISRIVAGFQKYKVPILIGGLSYFKPTDPQKVTRKYLPVKFRNWMFRLGMAPPHPAFYVKREIFTQYGNYRTDLVIAGDFDLMLRLLHFHRLPYKYLPDCWVMMSEGGKSTSGWKSILKNNSDILTVCKSHRYYSNYVFIYSKYIFKSIGLFFK